MAAYKNFDDYIQSQGALRGAIVGAVRTFVASEFPQLQEAIKFGTPFFVSPALVAYLTVYAKQKEPGLYMGFCLGTQLADPHQRLIGDGSVVKRLYLGHPDQVLELLPDIGMWLTESIDLLRIQRIGLQKGRSEG